MIKFTNRFLINSLQCGIARTYKDNGQGKKVAYSSGIRRIGVEWILKPRYEYF